ncbi:MAG: type II secretion system F family protein [Solirubrobacterales bacterium]|nr:type II secretion system F family protein [Solirubrobacterales bacterium]
MSVAPVLAALAGIAAVLALRDAVADSPALTAWIRRALEPVSRARLEGYLPDSRERLRLAALIALVAVAGGWWFVGPVAGLLLAVAAPLLAGWMIARGRRRYRRSVERSLPEIARAIADCLSAGHSPRGAIAAATSSLEGPARNEFSALRYELETGRPTADAIRAMAARFSSSRVDAFATALISQQLAGGDLAGLLRRFAEGAAERDRIAEDARSATAQARFTGYLVVAMPAGAALFVELIRPGFIGSILGSSAALIIAGLSVCLQLAGFLAISKLARVGEP